MHTDAVNTQVLSSGTLFFRNQIDSSKSVITSRSTQTSTTTLNIT